MLLQLGVCRPLDSQSYLRFLGKSHFGNIYIYRKLIAYASCTNNPRDIFFYIESTSHRLKKLKIHHLTNEKIRLFPEGSAELDGFKFIWRCIV